MTSIFRWFEVDEEKKQVGIKISMDKYDKKIEMLNNNMSELYESVVELQKRMNYIQTMIIKNKQKHFPHLYNGMSNMSIDQLKKLTTKFESKNCKNKDDYIEAVLRTIGRKLRIDDDLDFEFISIFDKKYGLTKEVCDYFEDNIEECNEEWNFFQELFNY